MESMKVEIDIAEARLAELTAELLTMREEVQFVKVSSQIEKNEKKTWFMFDRYDIIHTHVFFSQYRIKQRLP